MDLAATVEALYGLLDVDHRRVLAEIPVVLDSASEDGNRAIRSRALRVLGLARLRDGDAVSALEALDEAASGAPTATSRAEIEMSRVGPLAELGRLLEARAAAAEAVGGLKGTARARAIVQQAVLDFRINGDAGAVHLLDVAERTLSTADDQIWLTRLWTNRAHMKAFLGANESADADLLRAIESVASIGSSPPRGLLVMRAELAAQRGDIVQALRYLDEADHLAGHADGTIENHRSDVYRQAQLLDEAVEAIERAIGWMERRGLDLALAESLLALAEVELERGRWDEAGEAATKARRLFASLGRPGWSGYAGLVESEVDLRRGGDGSREPADLLTQAGSVFDHGLPVAATGAALRILEIGSDRVAPDTAEPWLRRAVRLGRPDLAVQAYSIRARRHLVAGRRESAYRSVRTGMEVFESHRATLGATELRARAGRHLAHLGAVALELATTGRPSELLRWMERTRAGALAMPPVRAPSDDELRAALAELRAVEQRIENGDTGLGVRRQALEARIRNRARLLDGSGDPAGAVEIAEIRSALDGWTLVAFDVVGDRAVAVGMDRRRLRRWELGSVAELDDLGDRLRFAAQRLVMSASAGSREAALTSLRVDGSELERRLLEPMGRMEKVLISPPSRFHALPFSVMPFPGPIAVAPSVRAWARAKASSLGSGRVALVAGSGLQHAVREIEVLARLHPDAIVLTGAAATVGQAIKAVDGARIAHFASHGRFRTDNPQFTNLVLADGGLNIYEFDGLTRPPETVVLSACEVGRASAQAGNELLGLTAGLMAAGTRSVIASVVQFPDTTETIEVMEHLHRALAGGDEPSEALADVRDTGGAAARLLVAFGV